MMTPAEEHVAFYRELGLAVAQWSEVERALYLVVSFCFLKDDHKVLGIGFVTIEGFRSKLLFADKVIIRTLVGTPSADEWLVLSERVRTQSFTRNKLAHFQTRSFPKSTNGRRIALCPWIARKGVDKTKPVPGSLCVRDIIKVRLGFTALTMELRNFAARAFGLTEPFPKSYERVPNPPTIRQIARQIHEELGHQQKSSREKRREEDAKNAAASLLVSDEK